MRDTTILRKRPIAHRGFHDLESPENSLGAFAKAVNHNYYIELDIQLSKDGEVMVFHDDTLKRMTGKEGSIHDYDCATLQTFKLGDTDYTIPTFKQVLNLVAGQTLIVVEFKNYKPTNEQLVAKAIELLRGYKGLFVTKSFNPFIMGMIRKQAPEFIRGQLVSDFKGETSISKMSKFLLSHMYTNYASKPDFISTDYHYFTKKMKKLQKEGATILFWTIRDEETYKKVKDVCDNVIFENFDLEGKGK